MPIHFEDRQAKYPNRWTAVKEDGTSEVITLVRNDEPIYDGTPMNAETLNSLSDVAGADLARAQAEAARTKAQNAAASAANSAAEAAASEENAAISKSAAQKSAEEAAASAALAGTRAGTDKTLSVENAPADAAVVGRYILDRTKDTPELVFYSKAETDAKIKEILAAQREEDYKRVRYWVSNDPTSPASFIGGTWERIEGEFIMGASDTYPAGSTGGAKTVTLTKENLPNYALSKACLSAVTDCYGAKIEQLKWGTTGAWHGDMMLGGSSQAFSILPPYLALYMWRRVA